MIPISTMTDSKAPAITVLMPAYNAARTIGEATASILGQTFQDFELLIIDDGSTDETVQVAESVPDRRLTVLRNPENLGLIATLNRGIELAKGRYIARMDADDISLPERFARQYQLMEDSPGVVACSAWTKDFAPGRFSRYNLRESDHEALLARMFAEPPLSHPASFIRRATFMDRGLRYNSCYPHCEDYRLWFDLSKVGQLSNVQSVLLHARMAATSVSYRYASQQAEVARRLRREIIADFFQRRDMGEVLPENITAAYLARFMGLYQGVRIQPPRQRENLVRQLNSIKYCLYMSMQAYSPGDFFRFLGSGDWLRVGMRGRRAFRIIRKHIFPNRNPPLL